MGAKQTKSCGSYADVKELEYISALHQTGTNGLRKDGSIRAVDIKMFLMSRYGIKTTEEEVMSRILGSFGECKRSSVKDDGTLRQETSYMSSLAEGDAESGHVKDSAISDRSGSRIGNDGFLDLTQVLALLLVPELLKAKQGLALQRQDGEARSELESAFVRHDERGGGKYWPNADLIDNVLRMILHDATGDPNPRPLTRDLLRRILEFYGETSISEDEGLLDDMLSAAASHGTDPNAKDGSSGDASDAPVLFDRHAFACALTHDVQRYDVDSENRMTSNFDDVFQSSSTIEKDMNLTYHPRLRNPLKAVEFTSERGRVVQRVFTFGSVDYIADTFRERGFTVVLWTTWISTYFAYLSDSTNLLSLIALDCGSLNGWAGCTIIQKIVNWLVIMVQLSVIGTLSISLASLGNSVYATNLLWIVIGMGGVALFVLLPFFDEIKSDFVSTEKKEDLNMQIVYYVSMIGGFLLIAASVLNIIQRVLSSTTNYSNWILVPGMIRLESKVKRAASFKMNLMVRNACEVHKKAEFDGGIRHGEGGETMYGKALLAFARCSDRTVVLRGGFEVWKRIYSGTLFEEDGIWFSTRMLAGNLAQCTLFLVVAALFVVFQQSSIFQVLLTDLDNLGSSLRWRLTLPLWLGIICSELSVFLISATYIPSTVSTIQQFRSGGIGSLHSKRFQNLRVAVDQSTLVFGAMFWGTLYTSFAIGCFFMVVGGLLLWPEFAEDSILFFSTLAGILITMLVKWIALIVYRRFNQSGYFRKKVALANLVGVMLESWNLGLTSAYMAWRSFKMVVAATLYIGRVDTPFLSEGATYFGPFELDDFPLMFRKDILAHEAHRHPYMERMGVMYMLSLCYDDFGSFAGTCWRMIFVYALAPWMRKYRISDGTMEVLDFRFAQSRKWTGRLPSGQNRDEQITEDDNMMVDLTRQNKLLKTENDMLRSLLLQYQSAEATDGPGQRRCST